MELFKKIIIVATTMLVFDALWLGVVAPRFYYENLKHLTRGVGKIEVHYGAAAAVYVLLVVAFVMFLAPQIPTSSWFEALVKSFVFGLLIYGVYDFTNMATLKDWPLLVSVVDMTWGGVLCTITTVVFKWCVERGFIAA